MVLEKRSVAWVIILSLITCGFYLLYWYYKVYEELRFFTGSTPTGNDYGLDLLLVIVTCGVWGVYVDYKIALLIFAYQKDKGIFASDTSMVTVILDVVGYISGYFTGIVSSAIHQDLINGMIDHATSGGGAVGSGAPGGSGGPMAPQGSSPGMGPAGSGNPFPGGGSGPGSNPPGPERRPSDQRPPSPWQ